MAGVSDELRGIERRKGILSAKTVDDVRQLVRHAMEHKLVLRVAGSAHSVEAAIGPGDDEQGMTVTLDGDLRKIERIEEQSDGGQKIAYVTVGAGCNHGRNPADDGSTWTNSLNEQLHESGYALPVLGGITHQTLGGFLQTGSAGGSLEHGNGDMLVQFRFVDGSGELREVSTGTDEFNAAGVAMGLFGVVTHVTFRAVERYLVEGVEENVEYADSFLARGDDGVREIQARLRSTEYMHLNWFPQRFVNRVMQWTGRRIPYDPEQIKEYRGPIRSSLEAIGAAVALFLSSGLVKLAPDSKLFQRIIGSLLAPFLPLDDAQHFRGTWYRALPSDDQAPVDGFLKTAFTEVWFPLEEAGRVLDVLETLVADPAAAGSFAVEVYGAKAAPFWLSPSFGRDVIRIDPFWWAHGIGRAREFFARFWDVLLEIPGARLHWGKHLPSPGQTCGNIVFNRGYLENAYERLPDWLEMRERFDPAQVFLSRYWREVLDIPKA